VTVGPYVDAGVGQQADAFCLATKLVQTDVRLAVDAMFKTPAADGIAHDPTHRSRRPGHASEPAANFELIWFPQGLDLKSRELVAHVRSRSFR
jgi:hypothetical protein